MNVPNLGSVEIPCDDDGKSCVAAIFPYSKQIYFMCDLLVGYYRWAFPSNRPGELFTRLSPSRSCPLSSGYSFVHFLFIAEQRMPRMCVSVRVPFHCCDTRKIYVYIYQIGKLNLHTLLWYLATAFGNTCVHSRARDESDEIKANERERTQIRTICV